MRFIRKKNGQVNLDSNSISFSCNFGKIDPRFILRVQSSKQTLWAIHPKSAVINRTAS